MSKKLSLIIIVLGFSGVTLMGTSGCKKDRLTAPTYSFGVTPPAATIVKGGSKTLTASGQSAGGAIVVDPVWEVSPAGASLNTQVGTTVIFTGTELGHYTVTATNNGDMATTHIAVVTYIPSSTTFDIYTDVLPYGVNSVANNLGSNFTTVTSASDPAPQGNSFFRAISSNNNYWGISLGTSSISLGSFTGGSLKFTIRISQALAFANGLQIKIIDTADTEAFETSTSWTGFNSSSTNVWQEVSIPLSSFAGVLDTIKVPFQLLNNSAGAVTIDVDAVRWEM